MDQFESSGLLRSLLRTSLISNPQALLSEVSRKDNRLDFRFHHPSRIAAEEAFTKCSFPLNQLRTLCEVRNESYVPSVDFADQIILYTGLAHIESNNGVSHRFPLPRTHSRVG